MARILKKTPTETEAIHEELAHHLALHKTDVAYIAVQTAFGEPFILIYTIKTADDFDSAVSFIQNYRRSGGLVALYTRADATHKMGSVAKKILEHEPEHPYKRGLQWLVADAEDCMWYRIDDARLFALSIDFYNLVVRELPDRYEDVFGMAIADMQRRHRHPFTEEVSELHTQNRKVLLPETEVYYDGSEYITVLTDTGDTVRVKDVKNPESEVLRPDTEYTYLGGEYTLFRNEDGDLVRVKNTRKPDSTDPEDDEPVDEPKDTNTVGHGDTEDVMNPDLTASYSQLLMF